MHDEKNPVVDLSEANLGHEGDRRDAAHGAHDVVPGLVGLARCALVVARRCTWCSHWRSSSQADAVRGCATQAGTPVRLPHVRRTCHPRRRVVPSSICRPGRRARQNCPAPAGRIASCGPLCRAAPTRASRTCRRPSCGGNGGLPCVPAWRRVAGPWAVFLHVSTIIVCTDSGPLWRTPALSYMDVGNPSSTVVPRIAAQACFEFHLRCAKRVALMAASFESLRRRQRSRTCAACVTACCSAAPRGAPRRPVWGKTSSAAVHSAVWQGGAVSWPPAVCWRTSP